MQPDIPTLDELCDLAWTALVRGANDRRHGFHLPVVATVRADGTPDARTVVLRDAERASRSLWFHTDRRAGKLDQLTMGLSWVFYDARRRLQVRVRGAGSLADATTTEARWAASTRAARKCYLVQPAPGTEVDAHTSGHHGALDGPVVPTEDQLPPARDHFAVVVGRVEQLEVLRTLREGHQRAGFTFDGTDWSGTWLVP